MGLRRRHIWIILFCIYIGAVVWLCFMKPDGLPEMSLYIFGIPTDKLAHFLMFLPYPIIGYGAFKPKGDRITPHLIVLAAVFAMGIGTAVATEEIQGVLGYRTNDVKDAYSDIIGLACASVITSVYIVAGKLRRK